MIILESGAINMHKIGSKIEEWENVDVNSNEQSFIRILKDYNSNIASILKGGGEKYIEKQHKKGRLTARERINYLKDSNTDIHEIGIFAGFEMYEEYGSPPAGGVLSAVLRISGVDCMVIANDATVKAGAYFEVSLKKTLRAQKIALENKLPIIYLVDSAGVFLPMQDQVFPDEAHFGKIFYNNAKISSIGLTQIACVMGPCVAGGAYLPVMCDKYIITEGSNMFLAAPALVKAAIGQVVDAEILGGATTHSSISGIADYHEKSDIDSLSRIKSIVKNINFHSKKIFNKISTKNPKYDFENLFNYIDIDNQSQYDIREVIVRLTDDSLFDEYKKNYGKTIVCGNAIIGGYKVGIIANQKLVIKTNDGKMQLGGVIYNDSADKAARFVMACNQDKVPIVFI